MRVVVQLGLSVLVLLAATAVSAASAVCQQPMRVIRNAEYEPDEDDRFLRAVLAHAGCELQITVSAHRVTLARRFELLRAGEIDLIIGVNRLPERETLGWFSVPFRSEKTRGWIRATDAARANGKSTETLIHEGWKVIGPSQGWFGPFYEQLRQRPGGLTADFKRIEQGVRLLSKGRGDLLIVDDVWLSRLPAEELQGLQPLPDMLHEEPLHFLYSQKTVTRTQVTALDAAINAVRASWPATP
ncbi:MAG TPA: transporter substrate-binding domain-containing protein [Permianibacter sp.]|nr:transporter substrate-binding domain-containing protein [Permianibacter sp.]